MRRIEQLPAFELQSTTSSLELIRSNIETERLEQIPLVNVATEKALIDDTHADELGASMRQKRGQLTPIAVRAKEDNGAIVYDIIDGFHRTEGKKRSGDEFINATVIYNCPDEELYDLRILAASSVRSVQFARIAQWITSSFAVTKWAKKGLTVSQAFSMAVADSSRSNIADLTTTEVEDLKEWVKGKSLRWGKTPRSVYQDMRLVANADPDLVSQVRTATGGTSRGVTITREKLSVVVTAFPGENSHLVQRAILYYAIENKLKIRDISFLVDAVRGKLNENMAQEEITQILGEIKIEHQVFPVAEEIDDEWGDLGDGDEDWDEEPTAEDLLAIESGGDTHIETGDDEVISTMIPPKSSENNIRRLSSRKPESDVGARSSSGAFARGEGNDRGEMQKQIVDLQRSLEEAHKALYEGENGHSEAWWRTAAYLTPYERIVMEYAIYSNQDIDMLSEWLKISSQQLMLLIRSSFAKRVLNERQRKPVSVEELK